MIDETTIRRILCQIMLDERLDYFAKAFTQDELLEGLNHSLFCLKRELSVARSLRTNNNIEGPDTIEAEYSFVLRSILQAIDRIASLPGYKPSLQDFNTLAQNWVWEYSSSRSIHRDISKLKPFLETVERIKENLERYKRAPVIVVENGGVFPTWAYDVVYSDIGLKNVLHDSEPFSSRPKPWQWLAGAVILGDKNKPEYARVCNPGKKSIEYDEDRAIVVNGALTNWVKMPEIEKEVAPERMEIV